jgi:hypothetical protein
MKAVICFFIQCKCAVNGRLLSTTCINVIHLPEEEQKGFAGKNGNKIFKKENQMY